MNKNILITGAILAMPLSIMAQKNGKPNIILIMADDMGYSDIGCYGSEIPTPNIDKLAENGVRFTQFCNTGRSCPTRASLLTGLYPHQAGIGGMSEDPGSKGDQNISGYMGFLNRNSVTIAEVLKSAGYHTYMTGKWHIGMHGKEKWPLQRGFERFYGILAGACSYLAPSGGRGLTLDNNKLPTPTGNYYTTDAFTDYAIKYIDEKPNDGKPFFLYLAYNAPHWPLHAKEKDIAKFLGKYKQGWQKIRQARFERMVKMGIIDKKWGLAQWEGRQWEDLTSDEKNELDKKMATYAAQVYCIDYNIGRLMTFLDKKGMTENTLVVFLSDNGACAEPHTEKGFGSSKDINDPKQWVAPSYGLAWAQVSNTPFRKYKVRAYEGGTSTPFIVSWPQKYEKYNGELRHVRAFLPDIMATFIDAAGTNYTDTFHNGNKIIPTEGHSILPVIEKTKDNLHEYIFGEHFDNCVVWWKEWKAVKDQDSKVWELYNLEKDRTECINLAKEKPVLLNKMTKEWKNWADTHNVYPQKSSKF